MTSIFVKPPAGSAIRPRASTGCLALLLLAGCGPGRLALAQTAPEIDAASAQLEPGAVFRFRFHSPGNDPAPFAVEVTADLGAASPWEESAATVAPVREGLFEVRLPAGDEPRFCRVRTSDPGAPDPGVRLNEVMSDNETVQADVDGRFWDWIELYNPNDEAVDLERYALSDDPETPGKWRFPAVLIQPRSHLLVYASGLDRTDPAAALHTNFRLGAAGEVLLLSDTALRPLDRLAVPPLEADQSIGRTPDGADEVALFARAQASPGSENSTQNAGEVLLSPRFDPDGGFFDGSVTVQVRGAQPDHRLHYTTDGNPPTPQSPVLDGALSFSRSTVLQVLATDSQGRRSPLEARAYFVDAHHELPVVSLAMPPAHLEFRNGYLYGLGSSVLSGQDQVLKNFPYSGSNAWQDREVEVAIELLEPDGAVGFRQRAGVKIFGGWGSRGYPQKSLALFARRSYGAGRFEHRLFPDTDVDGFEAFVLRNSGNDNQSTHQTPPRPPITEFGPTLSYGSYFVNGHFTLLRDALLQRLVRDTGVDQQAYRPAVVYINGEYWGIYNLREKMNEDYLLSHHPFAGPGGVDLIEGLGKVNAGSGTVYNQMRQYLTANSLSDDTRYDFVAETYLDIDNFIDYQIAILYGQNFDIGNVKCWRPRAPRGRFRWMLYDQDYSFNLWPPDVYVPAMGRDYANYDNMFRFYTSGTNPSVGWPNGAGQTLIFRSLLANDRFKARFIRRCTDLLNSLLREDRVQATIALMAAPIRPEIADHLRRWSWDELVARGFGVPHKPEYQPFVPATWEANLGVMAAFAANRPAKVRLDCQREFRLTGGLGELEVRIEPSDAGRVALNTLTLDTFPWVGTYFADLANSLRPIPNPGFRFVEWTTPTGTGTRTTIEFAVESGGRSVVTARMEPAPVDPGSASELRLTEIHYHPADAADSGDWIELQNVSGGPLDLAGWIFRDEDDDHAFLLPNRVLEPGAFLVLIQEDARFRLLHPAAVPVAGDFGFGLGNGGDTLRLFRPDGTLALSVVYDDAAPWPQPPDGDGFTLELAALEADPNDPASWRASPNPGGSPGTL
ncbi:MAG: CotH kinase family protein [Verrucomicrobiales bacterium]|nr:CotH kinase family protein [Verrucomicrobiales bacterium]MCP5525257.1 CotH kinase family protein [Verrucomicrobiales bacterium]